MGPRDLLCRGCIFEPAILFMVPVIFSGVLAICLVLAAGVPEDRNETQGTSTCGIIGRTGSSRAVRYLPLGKSRLSLRRWNPHPPLDENPFHTNRALSSFRCLRSQIRAGTISSSAAGNMPIKIKAALCNSARMVLSPGRRNSRAGSCGNLPAAGSLQWNLFNLQLHRVLGRPRSRRGSIR